MRFWSIRRALRTLETVAIILACTAGFVGLTAPVTIAVITELATKAKHFNLQAPWWCVVLSRAEWFFCLCGLMYHVLVISALFGAPLMAQWEDRKIRRRMGL